MKKITFTLNGKKVEMDVNPSMRLLDVLRDHFGLKGTKEGCGEGSCGACVVLVDGYTVNSCLCPIANVDGKEVVSIEGFSKTKRYRVIADAFADQGGSQCGFCTPGMILASECLLAHNPHPSADEIRESLSGNLCRCTGYRAIIDAILLASEKGEGLW